MRTNDVYGLECALNAIIKFMGDVYVYPNSPEKVLSDVWDKTGDMLRAIHEKRDLAECKETIDALEDDVKTLVPIFDQIIFLYENFIKKQKD